MRSIKIRRKHVPAAKKRAAEREAERPLDQPGVAWPEIPQEEEKDRHGSRRIIGYSILGLAALTFLWFYMGWP